MDKKLLEEIERIKLISGYSLKSTLTENINILLEKTVLKVANAVDPAVVKGLKNVMHDTPGFLATLKTIDFAQFGGITRMDGTVLKNSDEIFKALQKYKYKGLLFLDDIHQSKEMDDWWNTITLPKYDLSKYGHFSGSGIVVFDPSKYNIILE